MNIDQFGGQEYGINMYRHSDGTSNLPNIASYLIDIEDSIRIKLYEVHKSCDYTLFKKK
jgi:hypothetical protein